MSENETGQTDVGGDILGVAKRVASAGDRWFVSFARGLGRAAGRLRKETDIVKSSAKSAAATTGRVTVKMVKLIKPRLGSATPAPEKTGGGTAFDLLAAVAAHYDLDLSALRSNTEAVETIERLHRLCAPSEIPAAEAADAAPAATPVAESSTPADNQENIEAPSSPVEADVKPAIPDWYSLDHGKEPPPPVAEEASAGDTVPGNSAVDEAPEAPDDGAAESETETVARRSRKRRGPSKT
jgi:hypothetical protein